MKFVIKPKIEAFDKVIDFVNEYNISSDDLILTNKIIYETYFNDIKAKVFFYEDYGFGEPTDILVDSLYKDIKKTDYKRVIAIGGGAIIDVAKLFALKEVSPVVDLFEGRIEPKKVHELIIVPTTCGTGSEVTHISILALTTRGTKFGLQNEALYADSAVLIPELLEKLPYKVFATSSIDALVHAFESFTSPNASDYSRLFSLKAINMILEVYKYMALNGLDTRVKFLKELLIASNYAGIAFSNAGCAAVHAMSYPLGAKYHVPHGESNYVLFTAVYKTYMVKEPVGIINELNYYLSLVLGCNITEVYDKLDELLKSILPLCKMSEYGAKMSDIEEFSEVVINKQTRLTRNNYAYLSKEDLIEIYKKVF